MTRRHDPFEGIAMELRPIRASERAAPTAEPPRIQVGGDFYCNTCGHGHGHGYGSACACADNRTANADGKGEHDRAGESPTAWGGIVSERFCPVDGGPFDAGLTFNWKHVPLLRSGMQREHRHLVALCLYFWPNASVDHIRAFVYARSGGARWYRRDEILDAFSPFSQPSVRRWVFETQPPPYGVAKVSRRQLLDVAEFGIALVKASMPATDEESQMNGGVNNESPATPSSNRCAYDTLLVQKPWCYGPATSFVVMVGVEAGDPNAPDHELGSVARPRLWSHVAPFHLLEGESFPKFVRGICRSLSDGPAPFGSDPRRVVTWDDHPARSNAEIFDAVRSVTSSAVTSLSGSPNVLHGSPFVGVPRPLSHPGRAPAKRCLLDAIGKVRFLVRGDEDLCPLQLISHLQDALSSDLGWNGNALRWFDQYRED
jgi:hypothetical protein